MYVKIFYIGLLLISHVSLNIILTKNLPFILQLYNWFAALIVIILITWQVILISKIGKVLEITENSIRTEKIELATNKIDKIFVYGYFVQNIVFKRVGQRFFHQLYIFNLVTMQKSI